MEHYTIIGLEQVSYTNKQGKAVEGRRLHLSYEKSGCEGVAVEVVFIGGDHNEPLALGDIVELFYNKFGRVAQVSVVG